MRPESTSCCTTVWSRVRGPDAPLAHEIEAAVADVRPVGVAVLHHAGHEHGARRVGQAAPVGFAQDRAVRGAIARVEETRSGRRARGRASRWNAAPKQSVAICGRDLAVEVPAQAVGHHQQQRTRAVRQ